MKFPGLLVFQVCVIRSVKKKRTYGQYQSTGPPQEVNPSRRNFQV